MDGGDTNIEDDYEETEESLSLRDFPLTNNDQQAPQSSFNSTDNYFEFLTEFGSDLIPISHAEDIFFSGKLIPLNQQSQLMSNSLSNQSLNQDTSMNSKLQSFHQRRSESLSELKSNRSGSTKAQVIRNSRSFDDRKLNRNSSMNGEVLPEVRRNSGKSDLKALKPPRWYILTFGLVKLPPEMDLRDIKNRQVRRSNSIKPFPSVDAGNEVPANRSEEKCSSKLLRVLSCKGRSSVAVTASYNCIERVEEVPVTCQGT